jgi:hypothetical protein
MSSACISPHRRMGNAYGMGLFAALATEPGATATVLLAGEAGGRYESRPFWRYVGPESNPNSAWLSRGWGWNPEFGRDFPAAKDALQMPYMPNNVMRVKVPWWQPVVGPRPASGNEGFGAGGGLEWYRGWRFP